MIRVAFALLTLSLSAHPLASRVLVVYVAADSNSVAVANHYQSARGVPAGNMCPITLPDSTAFQIPWTYFTGYFQPQIKTCIQSAGRDNILYIVLAYVRPMQLHNAGNTVYYSLDSFIANLWNANCQPSGAFGCTNGYYANNDALNAVWVPFVSLAQYRAGAAGTDSGEIYSVWRLDATTTTIANALVDRAISAENAGGPTGSFCIDAMSRSGSSGIGPDNSYNAVDLDLYRAQQAITTAGYSVTYDINDAEFGTAPAPLTCKPTRYYAGWYSLNNYNGTSVLTWPNGGIGWHMDSYSMGDIRMTGAFDDGHSWSVNAILNGITTTVGATSEPYTTGFPRASGVSRDLLLSGANVGDAFLRNNRYLKYSIVNVGDPLYTPFPKAATPATSPTTWKGLTKKKGIAK